ncbi:hypothetical protein ACFVS2_25495 [Brevibacillus sp. NPDC058079]|uniref:hypothetical protein n=1 Tax=Brevibacillus sp. NPDC058079 TaxID=3346330 RepID=UPI0036F0FEC9
MNEESFKKAKKLGEKLGIQVERAKEGEKGGIFLDQTDGSSRELSTDDLIEMMFPGSIELLNKPSRVDFLRKAMEKEISDYREAVADDESYSQMEADEELRESFERRLFQEKFTLLHRIGGIPHEHAKEIKWNMIWRILKDINDLDNYLIEWDGVFIPAPNDHRRLERFSDFTRYIANQYGISCQL